MVMLSPRDPVIGGMVRTSGRMTPGGMRPDRRWSESAISRVGHQRPRRIGAPTPPTLSIAEWWLQPLNTTGESWYDETIGLWLLNLTLRMTSGSFTDQIGAPCRWRLRLPSTLPDSGDVQFLLRDVIDESTRFVTWSGPHSPSSVSDETVTLLETEAAYLCASSKARIDAWQEAWGPFVGPYETPDPSDIALVTQPLSEL